MKHFNLRASILAVTVATAAASTTTAQDTSVTDPVTSEVDISGELITTEQALHFVLSEDRVPNAGTVKLERLEVQFSERGNRWVFLFRDEDKTYEATVQQDRDFDLEKEFDEEGENAEFWASLPEPRDTEWPEQYLQQAMDLTETFNPTYTPNPRAIIEYEVCNPPENGTESEYDNRCNRNEDKEVWHVYLHMNAVIRGEEEAFYKHIRFTDGFPTEFNDANVSGNW